MLLALLAPRARAASVGDVALGKLQQIEDAIDASAAEEAQRLARTALDLAGPEVLSAVAQRLSAGGTRCTVAAWALGESSPEGTDAPRAVREALATALRRGDWDCRLAAASAAGRLGLTELGPDVVRLWSEPWRPPHTDGVVLLAAAGCAGEAADPLLEQVLSRSSDDAWAALAIAASLRRGPDSWPVLVEAACGAPERSVRATASLALLLLAEPRAGCALAECAAAEPDAGVRRMKYQALGAGGSPSGRALLLLAATTEADAEMRQAAASLALLPLGVRSRAVLGVSSREVRDALRRALREPPGPQGLSDIEAGASMVDLAVLERTLRLLPLRADRAWMDDHARLAQLRARLLCTSDPDCEPPPPRVGRPPAG
jgi:HEAT repeat protein